MKLGTMALRGSFLAVDNSERQARGNPIVADFLRGGHERGGQIFTGPFKSFAERAPRPRFLPSQYALR